MAINFETDADEVMSEINMTPFVDIMLVLLVVFIVTLPLVKHSVNLELPKVSSTRLIDTPAPIRLYLHENGEIYWDKDLIDNERLKTRMMSETEKSDKPVIQIHADKNVRYEIIAEILGTAHQNGITKIGFVTQDSFNRQMQNTK